MKELLKKESLFIRYFTKLNEKEQKQIIKVLTPRQVRVICGIIFNALRRTFHIRKKDLDILKKYNSSWTKLVNKNTAIARKKKELLKTVAGIRIILNAALKVIPLK